MVLRILWGILLSGSVSLHARADGKTRIPVVPYPQEVETGRGHFLPSGPALRVHLSGVGEGTARVIGSQLAGSLRERYGAEMILTGDGDADLWIGLPASDPALREVARREMLLPDKEIGTEGYLLKIQKNRIYIIANAAPGAFYGVQTLVQLLRGLPEPEQLPVLRIRDWPSISFRCVMDDISRGPVPTSEYMKLQVRRYAEMKINHMSFYIEHVVRTQAYPDLAPSNGGISVEEFRELSAYAADYQVRLVGNFQSLGHFEKILSLPQFRYLGATERMIDPLNPASMEFLGNIYREMAPSFSSQLFTPDCDEAWDLSRGGLTGAADSLGPARIYADHVLRIDSILSGLGKRTLIWGDIILEHPEILEMLPRHMLLGAWDYGASESFAGFIDPLKDAGFEFTVSPGVLNSNRLIPDFNMSTTNIRNFINEGYEKGTFGVYCTVWDDGGVHFFSHDWYGVAYNAEQSWRPNREPLEDFDLRFSRGIYGDTQILIPRTLHTLNQLTGLDPTYEMNSNVFWKTLVPARGEKVTFDAESWSEVKAWSGEAARILADGTTRYYPGDLDFIRFTTSQYVFMALAREELLEAADAYNRACELQRFHRTEALESLQRSFNVVDALRTRYLEMVAEFEGLWDRESRPYWKDRARLQFGTHLDGLTDARDLLLQAMLSFRQGNYLPPPAEVRLDIRRQTGQYFQYWLLAGSFPIDTFAEYPPDFLASMGGEAAARPYPGEVFKAPSGKEYMWDKYDSPKLGEIDLAAVFEPHETAVAYAYCTIDAPGAMQVMALLGSNDGATVWCNGKEVHHIHAKRSLIPDEDRFPLALQEGRNHLMIKVEQWKGDWGFSFRIEGVEVRNHKQKYDIQ
jgi:hexosaminidase